ncbi:hypothetical protein ACJMK2_031568 [Sinanodonta woodiana]|uniref:Uncharacterized protein n=1 Tax=Sinanodonta woodiana TaxID=1069815 RepID=A0ABD3X0Z5_SINWO
MFEDGQEIKRSGYLKGTPMKLWRNVFVFGVLMISGNLGYGIYLWIDRDRLRKKFQEYEEVQREKREREAMLLHRRRILMAARESNDYIPKKE